METSTINYEGRPNPSLKLAGNDLVLRTIDVCGVLGIVIINALSLLLWLTALTSVGQAQLSSDVRELPPNRTLERELTGAEQHLYKIDLQNGEFFQVRVEQKGADIVLRLINLRGTELARMDSPNGKEGYETLTFVARESGVYTL